MSGIRGRDTQPEMAIRRYLHRHGMRYRLHDRSLPGAPDLVFPRFNTVLFVHGCFWHRHAECRFATTPANNREFWSKKLSGNADRDRRNVAELLADGWRVIIIWECGVRKGNLTREIEWLPNAVKSSRRRLIEWPRSKSTSEINVKAPKEKPIRPRRPRWSLS